MFAGRAVRRAFGALAITAAAAGDARADDGAVRAQLEWSAPSAAPCVARTDVVDAVEARLGRRVFVDDAAAADVRLTAAVAHIAGGWEATLDLRDRKGTPLGRRALRNRACATLATELPIVIALLIDLPRAELPSEGATAPKPAEVAPPPATSPLPDASPRVASTPSEPGARAFGAISGVVTSGLLPEVAPGALVALGVATARGWTFEVTAAASGPATATAASTAEGARFAAFGGALRACAPIVRSRARIGACAGFALDAVTASGRGFDTNEVQTALVPAATAGGRLEVPIGGDLFLRVDLGASIPLRRDRFVFRADDGGLVELHRPAAIAPNAAIGVGVQFL